MAHLRKPLLAAVLLNSVIVVVELIGARASDSTVLLIDAVHNLGDEVALIFLLAAYVILRPVSARFLAAANLLNAGGLVALSLYSVWIAIDRLVNPVEVQGWGPAIVGVIAIAGNLAVAACLRGGAREDSAIQLAYFHNRTDALVSVVPLLSGIGIIWTGLDRLDSIAGLGVAVYIIWGTIAAAVKMGGELVWPKNPTCAHPSTS